MERCYVQPNIFYLEFINPEIGDPIISFMLNTYPERHLNNRMRILAELPEIGKSWTDMQELLEFYLLTYHKECLTKNNFLKNHFFSEAEEWYKETYLKEDPKRNF